jgi:hypothetical protein
MRKVVIGEKEKHLRVQTIQPIHTKIVGILDIPEDFLVVKQ